MKAVTRKLKLGESVYYPEGIVVKGLTDQCFWIEADCRRHIIGNVQEPIVQLSQLEVLRWAIGPSVTGDSLSSVDDAEERLGRLAVLSDGCLYLLRDGQKRRVVSMLAASVWGLYRYTRQEVTEAELHEQFSD